MSLKTVTYQNDFLNQLKEQQNQKNPSDGVETIAQLKKGERKVDPIIALARRVENISASGTGVSSFDLERLLGRNDLLPVNFLERGMLATRAVARLWAGDDFGSNGFWGTGFLVSPRLLLTNHHMINTEDAATRTSVQFGYQMDSNGRIQEGKSFTLIPEEAFMTDEELDFTLVAVAETSEDGTTKLSEYGFLRLDPTLHKVETEEFVTIIQHPGGQPKQIAIRENKVLQIGDSQDKVRDNFLWYASDTAPGSSGAPVFNDNWQVVAVHHRSVVETRVQDGIEEVQTIEGDWIAKTEAERLSENKLKWIANEGVRTSKILARISSILTEATTPPAPTIRAFLEDAKNIRVFAGTTPRESIVSPSQSARIDQEKGRSKPRKTDNFQGNVRPIEYYLQREGYDPNFLSVSVPLPELTRSTLDFGPVTPVAGTDDNILRYTHFSLVMCETRRLAFFTAVNIDGRQWTGLERKDDEWFLDPRIPLELQVGNDFYSNEPGGNFFDRGHLVRRQDPIWGDERTARLANSDTFHFTNCAPQYFQFNQSEQLWQGLENFILTNTDQDDLLASVFTGPIFQKNDTSHRGIQVPRFFWKVVLVVDGEGKLYSSAYVVSQEEYVTNIPFERLPVGEFNNFQISIEELEKRVGLRFSDKVARADVYRGPSRGTGLRGFSDIEHPRRKK